MIMTKITILALNRKFEKKGGVEAPTRRADKIEALPGRMIPCVVCKNPVAQSIGQIVRFHKECRTKGRKMMKRSRSV